MHATVYFIRFIGTCLHGITPLALYLEDFPITIGINICLFVAKCLRDKINRDSAYIAELKRYLIECEKERKIRQKQLEELERLQRDYREGKPIKFEKKG